MDGATAEEGIINDWVFPKEFVEDTSSSRFENCSLAKEQETRFKTIWFMSDLSNMLRPRFHRNGSAVDAEVEMRNLRIFWTAAVFFQRFYLFHSFDSHNRFVLAVACLFLAAKVEGSPMRLKDHVICYFKLRKNTIPSDEERANTEKLVLNSERVLLQTLNFDMNLVHPAAYFRSIVNRELKNCFADADASKQVLRLATTILSDSLRSTLCLEYTPKQLSYAIIFLAITVLSLEPASSPAATAAVTSITNSNSNNSSSSSSSGITSSYNNSSYSSSGISSIGRAVMPSAEQTWLDLLERQMDENILKNICFRLVDLYAQPTTRPSDAIKMEQRAAVKVNVAEFALESQEARLRRCSSSEVMTDSPAWSSQTLSPMLPDAFCSQQQQYQQEMKMKPPLAAATAATFHHSSGRGSEESKSRDFESSSSSSGGLKRKYPNDDSWQESKRSTSTAVSATAGATAAEREVVKDTCDGGMFDYDLPASEVPNAAVAEQKPEDTPSWIASTPNFDSLPRPGIA